MALRPCRFSFKCYSPVYQILCFVVVFFFHEDAVLTVKLRVLSEASRICTPTGYSSAVCAAGSHYIVHVLIREHVSHLSLFFHGPRDNKLPAIEKCYHKVTSANKVSESIVADARRNFNSRADTLFIWGTCLLPHRMYAAGDELCPGRAPR